MEATREERATKFPFGLLELNAAGGVARYEPDGAETSASAGEVVGRNFFDDIAPAPEVARLKGRFLAFAAFGHAEERLEVTFPAEQLVVRARLTLVRDAASADVGGERRAVVRLTRDS